MKPRASEKPNRVNGVRGSRASPGLRDASRSCLGKPIRQMLTILTRFLKALPFDPSLLHEICERHNLAGASGEAAGKIRGAVPPRSAVRARARPADEGVERSKDVELVEVFRVREPLQIFGMGLLIIPARIGSSALRVWVSRLFTRQVQHGGEDRGGSIRGESPARK